MSLRFSGALLAVAAILMAIFGAWSGNSIAASLWMLPVACLLAGLAYESRMPVRARVRMRIVAPGYWYLGRSASVQFQFQHERMRVLRLEVAPAAPADFTRDGTIRRLAVAAADTVTLEVPCTPRRLGLHTWPALRVRIGSPFGLAWWPIALHDSCRVRVGPEVLGGASRVAGIGSVGMRGGSSPAAGAELLQLRPYQVGDSPRIIDWKASARAQKLISRDFSEDQHLEILILIDAGRASRLRAGDLDRFGHYVNAAACLAQYAAALDDLVGLMIFADRPTLELAPARGSAAVLRIRQALAAARVESVESNPLHAAMRVRSMVRKRSLVVLFTDLDDTAVAGQLAQAVRLLRPKHLPFVAGLASAAAESLAHAPARHWLDPYRSLAAQEYCLGLERKVHALRALGVPALIAHPAELEQAVFDAYSRFRTLRRI